MPNKTENSTDPVDVAIANARQVLLAQAEKLQRDAIALKELETQARMSRTGTQEIPAVTVTPPTPPQVAPARDLIVQVAELLTHAPQDTAGVVQVLNVPAARVKAAMDKLRADGKLHNIGSEYDPRWQHVIGDTGPAHELRALVHRLISERPFSHRELVAVTGARENRISGALADLREDSATRVANLGDGVRARWFVIPADIQVAPLRKPNAPKRTKR